MKASVMAGVLAGALLLYIVVLAVVHSVAKIKAEMGDKLSLKLEDGVDARADMLELHSLHAQAIKGLKSSSAGMADAKKSLFNEGDGLQKFKFSRANTPSSAHKVITHSTQKPPEAAAKKIASTTRFGLPLQAPGRPQTHIAEAPKDLPKSSSGKAKEEYQARRRNVVAADQSKWVESIRGKLLCLQGGTGGVFLYHVRKAAGTSIRDVLEQSCARWHVGFYEVEGLTLDTEFLDYKSVNSASTSLLSVLTLRDPVERALSMYWYEHVGWWDGIQKKTDKCHTLTEWIATWRDSSDWKKEFMKKNPKTVYVEIENYYVKVLTGWTGPHVDGPLSEKHLEQAKHVLDRFDVVMLTEWMNDATQIDALNALFPGRNMVATKHMVKGDKNAKDRLLSKLAPNEADMKKLLGELNGLDLQLFEYAQSLAARRLREVPRLVWDINHPASPSGATQLRNQCGAKIQRLPQKLSSQLGIHQPPGHKAPL